MSNNPDPLTPSNRASKFGDRIRDIASQLRQEKEVQIQGTARILGAAAKLAANQDQLIDEVVEMVEEDLDRQSQPSKTSQAIGYTIEQLKQQFNSLKTAKAHFGLKANSWQALADKLNGSATTSIKTSSKPSNLIEQRLTSIEQELQLMRTDMRQIVELLEILVIQLQAD